MNLKSAIADGKLAQFVKERRADPKGDAAAFSRTLQAMARKSKAVPATSNEAGSDD